MGNAVVVAIGQEAAHHLAAVDFVAVAISRDGGNVRTVGVSGRGAQGKDDGPNESGRENQSCCISGRWYDSTITIGRNKPPDYDVAFIHEKLKFFRRVFVSDRKLNRDQTVME